MNDWDDIVNDLSSGPQVGPTLFKRASTGKIQRWHIEIDGNKFRTIHGQMDGNLITAEWTVCEGKNLGKKNETTPKQQAELEVAAIYKKKREQGGYFDSVTDIDNFVYVEPMLANKFDEKKVNWPVIVQPKLDGMRCIVTKYGCFSRKGKPIPAAEHIREQLEEVFVTDPELVLDGELYCNLLKDDFQELISIAKKQKLTEEDKEKAKKYLNYHVYDFPSAPGGYVDRENYFAPVLGMGLSKERDGPYSDPTDFPNVFRVGYIDEIQTEEEIQKCVEEFLSEGYEGGMIRQLHMPYEYKRTNQLMKYKNFIDEEFELVALHEGKGNWSGCAKIATIKLADGQLCDAGISGSKEYTKRLLEDAKNLIGAMATVCYFRKTDEGKLYLPVMKAIRDYD